MQPEFVLIKDFGGSHFSPFLLPQSLIHEPKTSFEVFNYEFDNMPWYVVDFRDDGDVRAASIYIKEVHSGTYLQIALIKPDDTLYLRGVGRKPEVRIDLTLFYEQKNTFTFSKVHKRVPFTSLH